MLLETQHIQLQVLKDIYDISCLCSTKTYVWGGFVIDILEGRFLREHRDIDCFTLNLLDFKDKFDLLFHRKGYTTEFKPGLDMYIITKEKCHATFNRLEIDKETAMWRHIGNEGTLFFPAKWIKDTPVLFYDVPVFISGIEFEYAIKAQVNLLSPEWQLRDTDKEALDHWTKMLSHHGIPPESIMLNVRSENPYWDKIRKSID